MLSIAPDGTRVNYLATGSGPPLVLVGGKTSTIESAWWRHIPRFSKEFRVIAFDNRGAGGSDRPEVSYTTGLMAEDATSVLDAAGEASAHWFGLSLGGMILQELALQHPDRVRSLILGSTYCGGPQPPQPVPQDELEALKDSPYRRLAHLYSARFILDHADHVAEDAAHFGRMPLHAIVRQDQAVRRHDACQRVGRIRAPVLILHGSGDRMVPVARAHELARLLPQAELHVLDDAGHQVHSERLDQVVALVSAFIHRVERERPV